MKSLLKRPTFGMEVEREELESVISNPSSTTSTTTTVTTTTVAPIAPSSTSTSTTTTASTTPTTTTTTTSTTTTESLIVDIESATILPEEVNPPFDLSKPVFLRYQPQNDPQFENLPALSSVELGCDCIKASGDAASALSRIHIEKMDKQEAYNCLDTLGKLPWPQSSKPEIWSALLGKIPALEPTAVNGSPLNREKLMLLANLLPAVAEANPDLIDVHEDNIDGLSILGSSMEVSKTASVMLVQRYIEENRVVPSSEVLPGSRVISSTEVASLGNLLCGLTDYQWLELITVDIFASTLVDHLANLDCAVS